MKREGRIKRHQKIRNRVIGTKLRPRLAVFRSSEHIYAQVIDDSIGVTIVSASDLKLDEPSLQSKDRSFRFLSKDNKKTKVDRAHQVGKMIAENAVKKGIKSVVFDRGGVKYHGRVKSLAAGARLGGLKF